ncbi:hypothetical protein DSM106972_020710 [Dulcicalothrix desertica PCC 7102]|uniref:Uncharacterized protein n=1 Tax=Dulcicalothrix desertica PCC 7102 TaxID=232991 RepID=A0A3S1ART6_9CYAN|nr:hypothetical protein [Dulcicalothrix desertica]RUT07811.1 hypothetical protein DSM106972_020710 [Dulcicalothrix desertica PCC 7102]TWH39335.1 cache domain-containing protein [Dulcicalothrix desertica PCC 7102]
MTITSDTKAILNSAPKYLNPIHKSIGSRLFFYVLSGALVGLGSMSYFFYQTLERYAKQEIQGNLSTQAKTVEVELAKVEQSAMSLTAAVKTMHRLGIQDAEAYRQLSLDNFLHRSPLTTGIGVAQAPYQLIPSRKLYLPYFFIDTNTPNQIGEALPSPYKGIRYVDVASLEDYTQQDYYKLPVEARKPIWLEPYQWSGITIATYALPVYDDKDNLISYFGPDVNVTALTESVKKSVTSGNGYFTILSKKGNILAYPPNSQKAKQLATYKDIPELKDIWQQVGNTETGATILLAPPKADLEILLELAQEGRLKKLAEAAEEIGKNPDYLLFTNQIIQLSKQFQTEQIENLLQKHINIFNSCTGGFT